MSLVQITKDQALGILYSAISRRFGLLVLVAAMLPALGAIWIPRWVVTQDNPAHLYNAHILLEFWNPRSLFPQYYQVSWAPFPNWAGHLLDMVVIAIWPPRLAEKVTMSVTLIGFAASVVWLRWRVAGWRSMPVVALLAMLFAINVFWLIGFSSFLLGSCLFVITLGVWWGGRERLHFGRAFALATLIVLGYASHLVSLGLTVVGLLVLASSVPLPDRALRLRSTLTSLLPVVPLGFVYLNLSRRGGGMSPSWSYVSDPWSMRSWLQQLLWADPITLVSRGVLVSAGGSPWLWAGLAPVVLLLAALALGTWPALRAILDQGRRASFEHADRLAWVVLATVLVIGGLVGPDALGAHGTNLSQRVVLLGLVSLVPVLDFEWAGWRTQACAGLLTLALALQSILLWHYAAYCNSTVGNLMAVREAVGRGQRVGTLLNHVRHPFRANPLVHADTILGIGRDNVIWNNYETLPYYFPVHYRDEIEHPPVGVMDEFGLNGEDTDKESRCKQWGDLLRGHHADIDVIVVWGGDPLLDAISDRWYRTVFQVGNARLLRRREPSPPQGDG